ncbi:14957_t:CDS:10 [Entrophospora sp. SA101]|nr:13287_t:CDS:10 [Entrophospora sp. SA101]CAJ0646061.1 4400_t:CDS:10 [Entrophospora sp. SA101]CAJ0760426.1 22547_t:CDS:10 [Entrophospora sp. SA101]CAJ0761400.1 14957_t:CDS:10 [Entrophospora sp. SA101]CAJ0828303.1 14378_t:CDS:10 [Entrophospora sp. SA101]
MTNQLRFGELVIGNWSPEGSHLAIPNACQGSVPVAIALRRDEWKIDVSMIGHESPTEVVCFSPILYHIRDQDRGTIVGGVCAIGSQDHGVSIWATSSSHPLLVFKQLFTHCILDLSWSPDGRFLFACSYDGTATILEFKKNQFGEPLKPEEQERILSKHGYKPKEPVIIENTTQLAMEEENAISKKIISSSRIAALMGGDQILSQSTLSSQTSHMSDLSSHKPTTTILQQNQLPSSSSSSSPSSSSPSPHTELEIDHMNDENNSTQQTDKASQMQISNDSSSAQSSNQVATATIIPPSSSSNNITTTKPVNQIQQHITITKDGKKRIQPNFLRSTSSYTGPSPFFSTSSSSFSEVTTNINISSTSSNNFNPLTNPDIDPPNREISMETLPLVFIGTKRKESAISDSSNNTANANASPNKRPALLPAAGGSGKVNGEIQNLSTTITSSPSRLNNNNTRPSMITPSVVTSQVRLSSHKVKDYLSKDLSEFKALKVECHNNHQGLSRIVCSLNKINLWSDIVPNAVTLIAGNDKYVAIGCENASVIIYDHSGLRLLPNIRLDSAASYILMSREYLLCLSQTGIVNVWKLPKLESVVSSVSITPIIQPSSLSSADFHYASIERVFIRPNGVPILMTDTNEAWCYHLSAKAWIQIYDPRYSSKEMKTSTEGYGNDPRRILNSIEQIARNKGGNYGTLSYLAQGESKLGHLYNQLLAAELVNSPNEYKKILLNYAQALADVGNEERINILCSRLLGPLDNVGANSANSANWDPFVAGMSKHELLKDVLAILSTNRSLQKIIQEYSQTLFRFTNGD